jgi:site-specific recombinase XerD
MIKKLPKIITQEEFEKLFEVAKKKSGKFRKEKLLAMLLGFEAGMRISEIVGFKDIIPKLSQEQIGEASIKILGKGGKERIVPRPKRMNEAAKSLLPLSISRRGLQSFITKLGKDVLGKEISFHTLRHGFCSHLANAGRPLHEIQMLAGHSRLDTTGVYLHANPEAAIKKAQEVF